MIFRYLKLSRLPMRNVNSIWVPPRNLVIRREYQQIPKTLFVPISQLTRFQ